MIQWNSGQEALNVILKLSYPLSCSQILWWAAHSSQKGEKWSGNILLGRLIQDLSAVIYGATEWKNDPEWWKTRNLVYRQIGTENLVYGQIGHEN